MMTNPFVIRTLIQNKPKRGIHSEIHSLVDDVRTQFCETARSGVGSFGFYLGFFGRVGKERVRLFLSESRDASNPKKLFWWKIKEHFRLAKM